LESIGPSVREIIVGGVYETFGGELAVVVSIWDAGGIKVAAALLNPQKQLLPASLKIHTMTGFENQFKSGAKTIVPATPGNVKTLHEANSRHGINPIMGTNPPFKMMALTHGFAAIKQQGDFPLSYRKLEKGTLSQGSLSGDITGEGYHFRPGSMIQAKTGAIFQVLSYEGKSRCFVIGNGDSPEILHVGVDWLMGQEAAIIGCNLQGNPQTPGYEPFEQIKANDLVRVKSGEVMKIIDHDTFSRQVSYRKINSVDYIWQGAGEFNDWFDEILSEMAYAAHQFHWPSTEISGDGPGMGMSNGWNEISELRKIGYQITDTPRLKRWEALQKAVPSLGLRSVAYHIAGEIKKRKGQKNGRSKFRHAISEWEHDLGQLKANYYQNPAQMDFNKPQY